MSWNIKTPGDYINGPLTVAGNTTITGDLTVATNVLKVDSSGKRVIIGATSVPDTFLKSYITDAAAGTVGIGTGFSASAGYQGTWTNHPYVIAANGTEQLRVAPLGVFTFSDGAGGTRMTLNSTGLGIGVASSGGRLVVRDAGGNDSYFGLGATNDIYLSTGATGSHYFRKAAASPAMTLDASGNLLVGKTTTAATSGGGVAYLGRLDASRDTGNAATFNHTTAGNLVGWIAITSTATTYNSASDYRLKELVSPLNGGLARVNALKPSIYKWKSNGSDGEGFLAHELAEVVPSAVTGEKDAVNEDGSIKAQGVDLSKVVPILVAAIQELTARVEALEA